MRTAALVLTLALSLWGMAALVSGVTVGTLVLLSVSSPHNWHLLTAHAWPAYGIPCLLVAWPVAVVMRRHSVTAAPSPAPRLRPARSPATSR